MHEDGQTKEQTDKQACFLTLFHCLQVVDSSEDSSEAQSKSLPHTSAVKKGPVGKTNKKEVCDLIILLYPQTPATQPFKR